MYRAREPLGKDRSQLLGAAIALGLASIAVISAGCTAKINDAELDRRAIARVGEVGLRLSLSPGLPVEGAAYTISRADGFYQRGTIPAGTRGGFSALLALPEALGYTIELSANSMGVRCVGSEHFDVWADRRVSVSVVVRCPGAEGNTGSVHIDGTLNVCPAAHAIVARPAQGTVGEAIRLYGTASDADGRPSPLTYAWSATSGALGAQLDDHIDFICTTAGVAAVTLSVSDGDSGCQKATTTIPLQCVDSAPGAGTDASMPEPDDDAGAIE